MRGRPHEMENSKTVSSEDKNSRRGRVTRRQDQQVSYTGWRRATPAKTPHRQLASPSPHAGITLIMLGIS